MDFSFDEKAFDSQEASKSIPKNLLQQKNNYEGDQLINIAFLCQENYNKIIQCRLNELTENVIKWYLEKSGLKKQ